MEWRLVDDLVGLSIGGDLSEVVNIFICVVIGKGLGSRVLGFVRAVFFCRLEFWVEGNLLFVWLGGSTRFLFLKGKSLGLVFIVEFLEY